MADMTREQLHNLARLGAQARLAQMDMEMAAIRAAYPDLAPYRRPGRPRKAQPSTAPAPAAPRARNVHRMSAAERKAVSLRMKRYWAERRKAKT